MRRDYFREWEDLRVDPIDAVEKFLGLERVPRRDNGNEKCFRCPFCEDKSGHLFVNQDNSLYFCHRCPPANGTQGHTLTLVARTMQLPFYRVMEMITGQSAVGRIRTIQPKTVPVKEAIPVKEKDAVYREFARLLPRLPRHIENLLHRGVPESHIAYYPSLPDSPRQRWQVCRLLSARVDMSHIPGFFLRTSRRQRKYWDCISGPGFLIPARDQAGRIQAYQIRWDNPGIITVYGKGDITVSVQYGDSILKAVPGTSKTADDLILYVSSVFNGKGQAQLFKDGKDISSHANWRIYGPAVIGPGKKYTWFSSSEVSSGSPCSFDTGSSNTTWIIEGLLKRDIAKMYLGIHAIGIPGIGGWRQLDLSSLPRNVVVAFDQEDNPHTKQQLESLVAALTKFNKRVSIATWDRSLGKGIDDAIATLVSKGIKVSPELFVPTKVAQIAKPTTKPGIAQRLGALARRVIG